MAPELLTLMTWTTEGRRPMIDAAMSAHLAALLPVLADRAGSPMQELIILPTHVHVVLALPAKVDLPVIAQALKAASARLVNHACRGRVVLRWANGYDARAIGRRTFAALQRYLDRQTHDRGAPLLGRWSRAA